MGPKIAEMLARKGLRTIEDLVYFLPRHYEDRRTIVSIAAAQLGKRETVVGEVLHSEIKYYARRRVFEAAIGDGTATMTATWFKGSSAYIKKSFAVGQRVILTGEIRGYAAGKNMIHPDYELLDPEDTDTVHLKRIVPVYSETEGLRQKTIRRIMMNVAEQYAASVSSPIPDSICRKRGLIGIKEALQSLHSPSQDAPIDLFLEGRSKPTPGAFTMNSFSSSWAWPSRRRAAIWTPAYPSGGAAGSWSNFTGFFPTVLPATSSG